MALQLNKLYVAFVAVVVTTGLAFIAWSITAQVYGEWSRGLPISGGWTWPFVAGVDLTCLACVGALYWKIYADSQTVIDSAGVSRPGIWGLSRIEWREVTDLKVFSGVGLHIYAGGRKVVISPYAYSEPEKVFEAVRNHAAPFLSQNAA